MTTVLNKPLIIKSPAFSNNEWIPVKYTCVGSNINPALAITDIPNDTKSLAIIVDDPDAPNGTFVHWVMWNVPVISMIDENSAPGIQGKNGKGENKYFGPCPPTGTHHYNFKVYALDAKLILPLGANKNVLLKAMDGHILASGSLIGLFKK
ncbi:YbhB/YbcL family Raf kinase inhibitor-like protein [Flavobacterium aquariorum]|uniref:YbhB/YbcL family Raf kinase inhibitor-like protein n=2 Tax=Flavobacterium aquariorum TaxID=2217670 RepID=A0A2W7TVR8_9FLAO|nr:YbhB/YbcL family Raf kinase inhibitor-like protein [Flavobacterium aquariorum]